MNQYQIGGITRRKLVFFFGRQFFRLQRRQCRVLRWDFLAVGGKIPGISVVVVAVRGLAEVVVDRRRRFHADEVERHVRVGFPRVFPHPAGVVRQVVAVAAAQSVGAVPHRHVLGKRLAARTGVRAVRASPQSHRLYLPSLLLLLQLLVFSELGNVRLIFRGTG